MNETISPKTIRSVIAASSVGTMIEWYDFYIFGMLAKTISTQFFPDTNPTAALLSTLAIFAAGFIVRPFGALVFGRLGDLIGRKYTFLLTLVLMGGSTFLIGLVPSYKEIGIAAPLLVLLLRLIQGLALGGEYGGAATYVAEHAPVNKRGYYTSWIQTTATLGLFIALGVILLVKSNMSDAAFTAQWGGWRYPFWISILLVGVSIYIRLKMKESPMYSKLKAEGKTSVNPLKESFRHKGNFKMVLLALFGAVMGQGVIWYTGQFYAQSFIENVCKIDFEQSRTILIWAILFGTPFFIVFGLWSDKVGRKWIMLTGMFLAIVTYRPLFNQLFSISDTANKKELVTRNEIKTKLIPISNTGNSLRTVTSTRHYKEGIRLVEVKTDTLYAEPAKVTLKPDIKTSKLLNDENYRMMVIIVFIMNLYVTMVYGPIAAFLVELFPTKIRYTSMSLPYHIGNGVFGGLTPFIATLLTTIYTGDKLVGLYYPIIIAVVCLVIGTLYISNKIDKKIND